MMGIRKGVLAAVSAGMGAVAGAAAVMQMQGKQIKKYKQMSDKHLALMLVYNQWMEVKQEGKQIEDYFCQEGIRSIAIYGMSYLGERLYDELKGSGIEVRYGIDRNAGQIYSDMDIILPDEELPETDAIVVTPVFFYEEIENMLSTRTKARIVSLEDILYEI